eukprot:1151319-Pelagomonas_calceolata.AAC.1
MDDASLKGNRKIFNLHTRDSLLAASCAALEKELADETSKIGQQAKLAGSRKGNKIVISKIRV